MDKLTNFINASLIVMTTEDVMMDFLEGISKEFSDSFILKGCMALKLLIDDKSRTTADIDMAYVDKARWEIFCKTSCDVATNNSKNNIKYSLGSQRGFDKNPNGDSLTINYQFKNSGIKTFKIDMNFKKDNVFDEVSIGTSKIKIFTINRMLIDKLNVYTKVKINRRIKDLIDIYLIASSRSFYLPELVKSISSLNENLKYDFNLHDVYSLDLNNLEKIKHSYEKYNNSYKPDFFETYGVVQKFVSPIFDSLSLGCAIPSVSWNPIVGEWY